MELFKLTLKETAEKLAEDEITSTELTRAYLTRIKKLDSKIRAYLTVTEDLALKQAHQSDQRRQSKKILSKIDGIPIAVKDLFCTRGVRTTAASKILNDFIPPFESTPTAKLWQAGAVLLGKTNLDEFAMGSSTENSAYQTTHNPWDLTRVPGGSSGGSAAAVAADLAVAALGTDTGGSIRQPASLCGIVGLKPTYGRISRYGVIAMASSLDQVGPMTKTVEDNAILLEILAGKDRLDSTSTDLPVPQYSKKLTGNLKNLKIGVPEEFFGQGLEAGVKKQIDLAIEKLADLGAKIIKINLPKIKYALAIYYIIMPAEVSSNLARYDGVRYGYSKLKSQITNHKSQEISLEELYSQSRAEGFGAEAKRRIMLGSYVLSSGYYDAYYKKAQQARFLVKKDFDQAFEKVDLIVGPVSPTAAFKIGEKIADPLQMYLSDIYTVPVNPAGLPAASVPAGFSDGLPVGLQIIGPTWSEEKILATAFQFEQATKYYLEKPKINNE